MATTIYRNPSEFLRHHQPVLSQVIAVTGIWSIADLCEQREIISSDMKDKIVSNSTGRTEKDRASLLIDTVRRLLMGYESDADQLDDFLCILLDKSGRSGRDIIKTIAHTYNGPLPKFSALIRNTKDNDAVPVSSLPANNIAIQPGQPLDVGSLYDALRDLINWDKMALKLPCIRQPDVDRIKIENRGDVEGQKMALYDKWLRADVSASWMTIITALDSVNEFVLARQIKEKLQLTGHTPTTKQEVSSVYLSPSLPDVETTQNERPNRTLDSKLLFDKSPTLEDILTAIPQDCDSEQFRNVLKVPLDSDYKTAIALWIEREPTDVTWRIILKALIDSSRKGTARSVINNYLKRPSVYYRYIQEKDYDVLDLPL